MNFFCRHDYEIIKDHYLKSQLELFMENKGKAESMPASFGISKYIIIYKCKKCNKIKETIISNF